VLRWGLGVTAALAALAVVTVVVLVGGGAEEDSPRRLAVRGPATAVWQVGADGGQLSTPDGSVIVNVPSGAAGPQTVVEVRRKRTSTRVQGAPGFEPLGEVSITPRRGSLRRAVVSVRYDPAQLDRDHTEPGVPVMLLSDQRGRLAALPTSLDPRGRTAFATWPHFSKARFGHIRTASNWLVDHVITYPFPGPKKEPSCKKKNDPAWAGADPGWRFIGTDLRGGKDIPALDGCAALNATGASEQRVEVTNRYWYAMTVRLPKEVQYSIDDALGHESISDTLLSLFEGAVFDYLFIPGHSRAHLSVKGDPRGQELQFSGYADPVAGEIDAVMSAVDITSIGTSKVARATIKTAEDELLRELRRYGELTPANFAEITADGSPWRKEVESQFPQKGKKREWLEKLFDYNELFGCLVNAGGKRFAGERELTPEALREELSKVAENAEILTRTCWKPFLKVSLGRAFKRLLPNEQAETGKAFVESLIDVKAFQSTLSAGLATKAQKLGLDFLGAKLQVTQARSPTPVQCGNYGITKASKTDADGLLIPQFTMERIRGAGIGNITATGSGCEVARKIIRLITRNENNPCTVYRNGLPTGERDPCRAIGFTCRTRETGYESSAATCTGRDGSVVRWGAGS